MLNLRKDVHAKRSISAGINGDPVHKFFGLNLNIDRTIDAAEDPVVRLSLGLIQTFVIRLLFYQNFERVFLPVFDIRFIKRVSERDVAAKVWIPELLAVELYGGLGHGAFKD
jgi:hypothetical protein